MGRTGRKNDGRIILLLTGKELFKYKKSFEEFKKLIHVLKNEKKIIFKYYDKSPTMI